MISTTEKIYLGLYKVEMPQYSGKFIKAIMVDAREGGMREFFDPISEKSLGSCGCNYAKLNVKKIN